MRHFKKKPTRQPDWKLVKQACQFKEQGLNVTQIAHLMKKNRKQIYRYFAYESRGA